MIRESFEAFCGPYVLATVGLLVLLFMQAMLILLACLIGTHIGWSLSNHSDPLQRLPSPLGDLAKLFMARDAGVEGTTRTDPKRSRFGKPKDEKDRAHL